MALGSGRWYFLPYFSVFPFKLTEFLFFTFLCSSRIYNMEIFTIFDEYFFGTSENKRLEQFSKIRNTLDNLNLNNDIEKNFC